MADQIVVEKLTKEEWEIAERIKRDLEYINKTMNGKIFCGIAVVVVLLIFLIVISWGGKQPKQATPAEFWRMLLTGYVLLVALICVGILGATISHIVYFRRQIQKQKDDLWLLSADHRARSAVRKLIAIDKAGEEIRRMKKIRDLLNPRDAFSSKIGRQFVASIMT